MGQWGSSKDERENVAALVRIMSKEREHLFSFEELALRVELPREEVDRIVGGWSFFDAWTSRRTGEVRVGLNR